MLKRFEVLAAELGEADKNVAMTVNQKRDALTQRALGLFREMHAEMAVS